MKRTGFILTLALVVLMLPAGCAAFREMDDFTANPDLHTPDLSAFDDAVYRGEFKSGLVSAIVDVDVKSHRFSAIGIVEHDTGTGKKAEAIVDRVIEEQSLEVEVVSGATVSSLVILKAIEVAFQ